MYDSSPSPSQTRLKPALLPQPKRMFIAPAAVQTGSPLLGDTEHGDIVGGAVLIRDESGRPVWRHGHFVRLRARGTRRHYGIRRGADHRHRVRARGEVSGEDKFPVWGGPDSVH